MRKLFTVIIIIMCRAVLASGQDPRFEYKDTSLLNEMNPPPSSYRAPVDEEPDILSDTTLYISKINISADSVAGWKSDDRFAYVKHLDSLLKKKQREDLEALQENQGDQSPSMLSRALSSGIIKFIFWAVAIIFIAFILYKLFFSQGIFRRRSVSSPVNALQEEESGISPSDYDRLLRQSILLGDFRMAVRYLFLKTLKRLNDNDYLQQATDKTNYQYVQEIEHSLRNEFSSLVLTYEYTWYGNFPLTAETFKNIEGRFNSFDTKIAMG